MKLCIYYHGCRFPVVFFSVRELLDWYAVHSFALSAKMLDRWQIYHLKDGKPFVRICSLKTFIKRHNL